MDTASLLHEKAAKLIEGLLRFEIFDELRQAHVLTLA